MIAVRMDDARRALAKLDPASRALLELSLRRGLGDDEIAGALHVSQDEVARRRASALERLGELLRLDGQAEHDELFATLPDLPAGYWRG